MKVIMASTSTIYGSDYLAYLETPLKSHFESAEEILFIPFARPSGISHDDYTQRAAEGLAFLSTPVVGLHQKKDPAQALEKADAIFVGGGNTFLLVSQLYKLKLMETLTKVVKNGTPYLGTSAGSNICGLTMMTTNDMPIIYPPSFKTMGLVPFNINAHYLDPDPNSTHKGETRETRLKEFQTLNNTAVVGLREGSWLAVSADDIILKGTLSARVFEVGKSAYELSTGSSLKTLT